jgi:hypothetical protein
MPLGIYEKVAEGRYVAYSTNGDQTNPITTVHHGRNGDTFERRLFLKADNNHVYTNISVKPISKTSDDDIGLGGNPGTSGWGVKVMADPNHTPTEKDWDSVEYGVSVDYGEGVSISDTNTVIPFWFRIESPRGINVTNKENIALQLLYTDLG